MNRVVITQAGVSALTSTLISVASNLNNHATLSLSKAHGINALHLTPGSVIDAYGNDRSGYYDNHGDLVGDYQLVWDIGVTNRIRYWSPATATALSGYPFENSAVVTSTTVAATTSQLIRQQLSGWITDYTTSVDSIIQIVNDTILLQHSLLPYQQAHSGVTVSSENFYSANGHKVGSYKIKVKIGNVRYEIPASRRLGGPVQQPKTWNLTPVGKKQITANENEGGPSTDQRVTLQVSWTGGTNPFAVCWQQADCNDPDHSQLYENWTGDQTVTGPDGPIQVLSAKQFGTFTTPVRARECAYYWPLGGDRTKFQILGYNAGENFLAWVAIRAVLLFGYINYPDGTIAQVTGAQEDPNDAGWVVYTERCDIWFSDQDSNCI